jgi:hypothetical protein
MKGPTYEWASNLFNAWHDYDWYEVQDKMNEYSHYLTKIEDVKIHFVHARSDRSDAIPLIMCHGWPGTFWEFSEVCVALIQEIDERDC